jgi:Carboxypeptidase regulatory-like domain
MKLRLKVRRPTQESLILLRVETGSNRSILSEPLFICAAFWGTNLLDAVLALITISPSRWRRSLLIVGFVLLAALQMHSGTGGGISGTLLDPSGAAISGAALKLVNTGLQTTYQVTSDKQGSYSFPNLPVGHYELTILADGFTTQRKTNLKVDTDSALRVDATLAIGGRPDSVTVTSDPGVQVETSTTHLGEVVSSAQMTSLPLNGRSYTRSSGDSAWSGAYIHFVAKLRDHGRRYRRPRSFG